MNIDLNEGEIATILVGLCEFDAIISDKIKIYSAYEKINNKLISKFRDLNWVNLQKKQKSLFTKN